jgi:hypothetical protein
VKTIEIPAKCEELNGMSVIDVDEITLDPNNSFFIIDLSLNFLKSSDSKKLIRYIGSHFHIMISKEVEKISAGCFYNSNFVCEITFECESKLEIIEESAFQWSSLEKIRIPASAEIIQKNAFCRLRSSCTIIFEAGSKLRDVNAGSFDSKMSIIRVHQDMNIDLFLDKDLAIEYIDSDEGEE